MLKQRINGFLFFRQRGHDKTITLLKKRFFSLCKIEENMNYSIKKSYICIYNLSYYNLNYKLH